MSSGIVIHQVVTREQAQTLTDKILFDLREVDRHIEEVRVTLRQVKKQEAYKALDYDEEGARKCANFSEYVTRYLPISISYAYRLVGAESISAELGQELPEAHARELAPLKSVNAKQAALRRAESIAIAEGSAVTAKHIAAAVQVERATQTAGKYAPVAHLLASGEITPPQAQALTVAIDRLSPMAKNSIFELMALYGLRNPELIEPIAILLQRHYKGDTSLILAAISQGTLGGVPLRDATLTDYENERIAAQKQHIEDSRIAALEKGEFPPVQILIYPDKPALTVHSLKMALTTGQFEALLAEMMKE